MNSSLRRLALTAHITSSVGWLGAVAGFLALAIAGVTSAQPEVVRGSYIAMHVSTWFVIVPLCIAALATGIIESLGTPWGLFRHYWVVTKLVLTVGATAILLLHTQPIDRVAAIALERPISDGALMEVRVQLVGDAAAALFVLLVTTTLSVFKPFGMTPYGLRRQAESLAVAGRVPRDYRPLATGRYLLLAIAALIATVLVLHLLGIGVRAH